MIGKYVDFLNSIMSNDHMDVDILPYFGAKILPPISITDYVYRCLSFCKASESTYIITLILIIKIKQKKNIKIHSMNIHRIFAVSLLISIKICEDFFENMYFYSNIFGLPVNELIFLEKEYLKEISFDINVTKDEFELFLKTHGF